MLDLGSIVAGTMFRGQFEARIKKIFEEIIARANLIIFIDELHAIIGTGSAEGSLDAANLLKPFLSKNQLRLIGATTFDEYKKQIEKDKAFERRFQVIKVSEPDVDQTVKILQGLKTYYEKFHQIKYTDEALASAAELADRYVADRKLPDKAIDLIDEAAANTNINTAVSNQYLVIQKKLSKLIKEKEAAVNQENYQRATEIRQEEVKINNQLTKLRQIDSKERKKLITKEDILETVSRATGIPVNSLSLNESLHLSNLSTKLKQRIVGQNQAVEAISRAIKRSRVGISDPNRPIGSFIFLGPTGVGKTELAKVLAEEVFGNSKALIKIDMSEFMERHNLSRLVGAPAGYVGFDEGGKLTEQVRNQPYSLILFDEIEKAHPDVFNLLLQIFEDGTLTDAKGRVVNFKNTMIILTSNIGSELFNHRSIGFNVEDKIESSEICNQLISNLKEELAPEFINRLDEIIVFNRLFRSDLKKIVKLQLRELAKRLQTQGIKLKVTDEAHKLLEEEGFDLEYGARPLKRIIANKLETEISDLILKYGSLKNRTVKIDRQENKFSFTLI
jgi:ATP-dependent Clp protease ATP-binding subunit ClpC